MKSNSRMGLSILTSGLAFVGSAGAVDLIVNGSFETEGRVPAGSVLTGWTGFMGTYNHSGEAYYAGPPIPASENPGSVYSWQHRAASGVNGPAGVAQVTQTVDLTTAVAPGDIDASRGQFTFSAWLASYTDNPEQPYLTLEFLDAGNSQVGSTVIFDRATANFWATNADPADPTPPAAGNHMFSKYVRSNVIPSGARTARVGIGRSPNAGLSGSPDSYVDLVKLDVTTAAAPVPPSVATVSPADGADGVRPDVVVNITLGDGTTAVNTNSIQFSFDGMVVTPIVEKTGATTTLRYDPPGILAPFSAHSFRLVFSDNGTPVTTQTNIFSFTNANYYNIVLPAPISLQTFEGLAEGALPAGWSQTNYTDKPDLNVDFGDLNSAAYASWTVMDSARFNSSLLSYSTHDPTDDYRRVLSTNQNNVVNGAVVENLAQGRIAFADSGYRDGLSQVLYLFTEDFDLSGRTSVFLAFNSLWEQNQDSIAAVEYSIDQGATWLPVVYYLEPADIFRDAQGNIDALTTFTNSVIGGFQGQPTYVDPISMQTVGGHYGAFIGVASNQWSQLAPYISARAEEDPVASKRVEVFRLPAADNRPAVRLRFAHAGTDSWYFGIDDVGLYSIPNLNPPNVVITPTNQTEALGNSIVVRSTVAGIGPFTYQWKRNGVNVPGQTNASLSLTNLQASDAGTYTVEVGYPDTSATYGASVVNVISPAAFVIGQWDFENFDPSASCGAALEFFDLDVENNTGFTSSDVLGLPSLEGQPAALMTFPGVIPGSSAPTGGYKVRHGLAGNGGGTNVNQYTLIMDLLYPAASHDKFRALLQTDPFNTNDAEFFINTANGIGINGVYHGSLLPDTWYRIALAVDLSGPGPSPVVAKFINGVKVGQQTLPEGRDGRWSLSASPNSPWALLFADNDADAQPGYVSSIQLRNGRLSDAAIASLGGPTVGNIPGCISISKSGNLVVQWSGGVPLQSADTPNGPWTDIVDAISPYTVPSGPSQKFYRPKF